MELTSIQHLARLDKNLIKHATVLDRIEAFLEDMNVSPVNIPIEFSIGSAGRPRHVFSSSMIGEASGKSLCNKYPMGCGRKLYYAYTGEESQAAWTTKLRRRLDEGTALHALAQAYLLKFAEEHSEEERFDVEVRIDPDKNEVADLYDLSGHVDGVYFVHTPHGDLRFGLEIKTISDKGFQTTSGPHAEHLIQGTIYQKCLDLPLMVFLYWNVNDGALAEYVHVFDPDRWDAVVAKLNKVRDTCMSGGIPDQEVSYSCRNCQYQGPCKPPKARGRLDRNVSSAFRRSVIDASRTPKE